MGTCSSSMGQCGGVGERWKRLRLPWSDAKDDKLKKQGMALAELLDQIVGLGPGDSQRFVVLAVEDNPDDVSSWRWVWRPDGPFTSCHR